MKRRYTAARVPSDRGAGPGTVPGIALSSDFIVGFPGETEEDFQATLALVREVRFASLFAFRYSPRPGTASARWGSETEVPEDVAARSGSRGSWTSRRRSSGSSTSRSWAASSRSWSRGPNRHGQTTGRTPCNRIVHLEIRDAGARHLRARPGDRGLPTRSGSSLA